LLLLLLLLAVLLKQVQTYKAGQDKAYTGQAMVRAGRGAST
jgi:hypothetical protein